MVAVVGEPATRVPEPRVGIEAVPACELAGVTFECDEPPGKEAGELQWLLAPPWFGPATAGNDAGPVLYADRAR